MNWRAELRAAGVERRPSNDSSADRGYVEQPGEGAADKPPPSVPRLPPHSQRPQSDPPLVLRRPVTSITPAPEPPRDRDIFPPPLPPPSAAPTEAAPKSEPPQQTLVKLVRPEQPAPEPARQACGKRARRFHAFPEDFKAKVVARYREVQAEPRRRGDGVRSERVAAEFDISKSLVHRWLREEEVVKMPNKANHGRLSQYSQEERDEWARKVMAYGRGGGPLLAKQAKVPLATIHGWVNSYRARHPEGRASQSTLASSGLVSKVQSKPNGAASAPAPLGGFLTGLDEYIAQLVDARVEQKLVEILKTKSLMELMRQ